MYEIKNGLKNQAVEYKKTEPVPSPPSLFQLPTLAAFVGQRGRGKTNAAVLLIQKHLQEGYFTRVFIISPTYHSNEVLHVLPVRKSDVFTDYYNTKVALKIIEEEINKEAHMHKQMNIYLKIFNKFQKHKQEGKSFMEETEKDRKYMVEMQTLIAAMQMEISFRAEYERNLTDADHYLIEHLTFLQLPVLDKEQPIFSDELNKIVTNPWPNFFPPYKMKHPVPILFIDDMSHSDIYSTSRANKLVHLCLRHRHVGDYAGYGLNIYFAVQTFKTGVPKALRANTQQFYIFWGVDEEVLDNMYIEFSALSDKNGFFRAYYQAVGLGTPNHDFLTVDKNALDFDFRFRKNFDIILDIPYKTNHDSGEEITIQTDERSQREDGSEDSSESHEDSDCSSVQEVRDYYPTKKRRKKRGQNKKYK